MRSDVAGRGWSGHLLSLPPLSSSPSPVVTITITTITETTISHTPKVHTSGERRHFQRKMLKKQRGAKLGWRSFAPMAVGVGPMVSRYFQNLNTMG